MSEKTELNIGFENPIQLEKLTYFGGLGIEKNKTPKEVLANIEFYDPMGRNLKTDFERIADEIKDFSGIIFVGKPGSLIRIIFVMDDGFYDLYIYNVTCINNLVFYSLDINFLGDYINFRGSKFWAKKSLIDKLKMHFTEIDLSQKYLSNPKFYINDMQNSYNGFNQNLFEFAKAIVNWD